MTKSPRVAYARPKPQAHFASLAEEGSDDYTHELDKIAARLYGAEQAGRILGYIVRNCDQTTTIIMNSERDKNVDFKSATSPAAMFTFIIGGNIVSRGVTFDNLLSMFFTRDSKHKIQQDTYIQRARMFGSRKKHLSHFELTIFVCGTDGLVTLSFADLHTIVSFQESENAWVSVSRPPRAQYELSGNRGELEYKVVRGISLIHDTLKTRAKERYATI